MDAPHPHDNDDPSRFFREDAEAASFAFGGDNGDNEPHPILTLPREDVVAIARLLVREYAEAHDFSTEDIRKKLSIEKLVTWVAKGRVLDKCRETVLGAGIAARSFAGVRLAMGNSFWACEMLVPLWPLLTTPGPVLSPPPLFVMLKCTLGFRDETVIDIQTGGPWPETVKATEGHVLALVGQMSTGIQAILSENGLEAVREKWGVAVPGMLRQWEESRKEQGHGDS